MTKYFFCCLRPFQETPVTQFYVLLIIKQSYPFIYFLPSYLLRHFIQKFMISRAWPSRFVQEINVNNLWYGLLSYCIICYIIFLLLAASANVIFMLMANLNSCTNPLIYLVFVDILRHQFCRKGRRRSSSLYSDSTRSTRINFSNSLHYSTVNTVGSKKDSYNSRGALMLKQLHRVSDKNKDNCKIEVASVWWNGYSDISASHTVISAAHSET